MSSHNQNFEAFLHIVHVSDIHCRDGGSVADIKSERFIQRLIALLRYTGHVERANSIEELWEEGFAGHDPSAHEKVCEFLDKFAKNPVFGNIETWLLDTGDISSMGDISSLDTAIGWLKEYRNILKAKHLFHLYGNHDAWPGVFPLTSTKEDLDSHRKKLRSEIFPRYWPQGPLSIKIPHAQSELLLYGINSVIDDRLKNTFALGEVDIDPNWVRKGRGIDQLEQLAFNAMQNFKPNGKIRDFRIIAVHHPVHYPPPKPAYNMILKNDTAVANALINFDQKGRGKLAHLVLSGHTHQTYPPLGKLPPNTATNFYQPLTRGQLQLITGSLSQMPRYTDHAEFPSVPHQFQILTFFAAPKSANRVLLIERRIVGRPGGTGSYKFIPPVESVMIDY